MHSSGALTMSTESPIIKPIIPYLKLAAGAEPYLEGWRCDACGEIYLEQRSACGHCLKPKRISAIRLSNSGKIYNWTIVHRNFPGVAVPFVSVVVDLDGGGTVKGNLIGVEPVPEEIRFDMPVKTVFRPVEKTDSEGNTYIGYFFAPADPKHHEG
jgi:uncharacterized OB-fold protein